MSGKVKAFAKFGVTLNNEQWSWSGRAPDGRVVVTIWRDEFNFKSKPPSVNFFGHPRLAHWTGRPGNRERIENLKWARDHRDGKFNVVIVSAKDKSATVREIDEAYASNLIMQLTALDETTGEYSAEVIGKEP